MGTHESIAQLSPIFTRRDAARIGLHGHHLRRLLSEGELRRITRGVYATGPATIPDGEHWEMVHADHLRRCREVNAIHPDHVLSHLSAAVVHGLAVVLHPAADVHLTAVKTAPRSRREPGVQLHHCDSMDNVTERVDGLRVMGLHRTVADCLRTMGLGSGVALLDDAIRAERTTVEQVRSTLNQQLRWAGRPRGLRALSLHDPRHETWFESYSFAALDDFALPPITPQVEIYDETMRFVGRVDGFIKSAGVFLEADGQGKYLLGMQVKGLSREQSIADAVAAQELRHERLEGLGLIGVRWTLEEIRTDAESVALRIRDAVMRGENSPASGWMRRDGLLVPIAAN